MRTVRAVPLSMFSLVLSLLLVLPAQLRAQVYNGSIQGEVTDSSGAKIPGAVVTATEMGTHFKTVGKTNEAGDYTFASLTPGTYVVTSTAPSFKTENRPGVVLTAGQLQKVDFSLTAGATSETVEVSAENLLLDAGSANIATTLSTQEVTDLPNEGRNPFVMATLAAGVIDTGAYFTGKAGGFINPFSGVAVQITSDGSGGHNRLTINGIPDDPAERFSGATYTGFVPSPEAVQEVKVQTSIFDAQVGHGNGTVTNTVIRGGANKVHGAAYYVFQNTYFNANTSEKVANNAPRNNDQLSQTGAVFDGPVYIPKLYDGRDKTFFLVSFERYASHQAINFQTHVPTAAELTGDFSGLCSAFNTAGLCTNGIQIYDPQSPLDANGNRTSYFANNLIPTNRINSTGAALLSYLPAPNVAGATATTNPNYVSTQTSYPSTYPSFITRIDQAIRQKDKLNAIFFRSGLTQNYPLQGFPKGIGPAGYGYHVYRNNRGGSLDEIHTFSPTLVLDSRFGLLYHPFGLVYPGSQGVNLSSLGITTTLPYNSFPGTSESDGYATLANGAGGQISENTTGSLNEIVTKTFGKQSLRIGFEGDLVRYNVQNPQSGFGNFAFDRHFTQQNYLTASAGTGDPLAAELLGAFSSVSYNISAAYALQQIYMAPFLQDDWRITPKLTLNLGLRYDYESPLTERYNKQVSSFCTTCVNPIQSSVVGVTTNGGLQFTSSSNRYPYPKDLNNLQPRLGAAYQATPTTVVRAGFGVIYFNTLETPVTPNGFTQSTSYTNYSGNSTPIYSINNPFPTGVTLPTGSSLGLLTSVGQNVSFVDPGHVSPKSVQYSASVQQQFPGNLALQIAYVGTKPSRLEVSHNINILPASYYNQGGVEANFLSSNAPVDPFLNKLPGTSSFNTAVTNQQLLLPFPEFGSVTETYSSIGSAPYNALQVQVSKPMRHHYSLQGNFTWDKLMLHNAYIDNYAAVNGKLDSVQDGNPTLFGNFLALFELPKLSGRPAYERLTLGGWQVNTVVRFTNGPLISAPSNVDIVGDYHQPNRNLFRTFNPCYQSVAVSGAGVISYTTVPTLNPNGYNTRTACDTISPNVAFRQRAPFTSQNNSNVLGVRFPLEPLADLSVFKKFILREGVSFEIRGEFYNVLNTPNWPSPNTTLGASNTASRAGGGSATNTAGQASQANDPRIGQLTARINF